MARSVTIIGVPTSAGAYAPGQEKAPAAFRRYGLADALRGRGFDVADRGDIELFRWRTDRERPNAMNLAAVRRIAGTLARVIAAEPDADLILALGGDCTIELGMVAGALQWGDSMGLIYVDADVDLTVPATADGAFDWMGVAHLLDIPGAVPELAKLGPRRPMLAADEILFFAAGNITAAEAEVIAGRNLRVIPIDEVAADPEAAAAEALAWSERFDTLLVHLDMDVLNFAAFPIAENTRRDLGLDLGQLQRSLQVLLSAPNLRALTVTELNPDHAPDEAESMARVIDMLAAALAAKDGRR